MIVIRFNVFYKKISINVVTEFYSFGEVRDEGIETVAEKCLEEIKNTIGFDLKAIEPERYLSYCSFIYVKYNAEMSEPTEKERMKIE